MSGNGKTTRNTDKALTLSPMETNTSVSSKTKSITDKELTLSSMGEKRLDILSMVIFCLISVKAWD